MAYRSLYDNDLGDEEFDYEAEGWERCSECNGTGNYLDLDDEFDDDEDRTCNYCNGEGYTPDGV